MPQTAIVNSCICDSIKAVPAISGFMQSSARHSCAPHWLVFCPALPGPAMYCPPPCRVLPCLASSAPKCSQRQSASGTPKQSQRQSACCQPKQSQRQSACSAPKQSQRQSARSAPKQSQRQSASCQPKRSQRLSASASCPSQRSQRQSANSAPKQSQRRELPVKAEHTDARTLA